MATTTHIPPSGGLISAAFIEKVREPGSRQPGVKPASFDLPWVAVPKSPAALEETIATAGGCCSSAGMPSATICQ